MGLVAGGVTELVMIVGVERTWQAVSTRVACVKSICGAESDAVELVEGRCSCRNAGKSVAARESRFLCFTPVPWDLTVVTLIPTCESRRECL